MRDLSLLSDDTLHERTLCVAWQEQALTLQVLRHLEEIHKRRLFARRGFASLFEYAVRELGYSESAASQRISALRLMSAVPEARERIESGALSLWSAAAVQRFVRREEKTRAVEPAEKRELVRRVAGLPSREVERVLAAASSTPVREQERERVVSETRMELRLHAGPGLQAGIARMRELHGPMRLEEIFERALEAYLERHDPLRKRTRGRGTKARDESDTGASAGESGKSGDEGSRARELGESSAGAPAQNPKYPSAGVAPARKEGTRDRFIPAALRRAVWERSGGRCEYVEPRAGRRCESRARLQIDHIEPLGRGGRTEDKNLRHLCPAHNQWQAIASYGYDVMGAFS